MAYPNIEAERARIGMTRAALAEEMKVSLNTYKKYVSGETSIPSEKLVLLHRLFGVSTDYLLGINADNHQ